MILCFFCSKNFSHNELNVREGALNINGTTGDLIFNFGTDGLEFTVPTGPGEIVTICPA